LWSLYGRTPVPENLENTIEDNAKGPKRVRGDSGEMEQHSLKDQIEADRYINSKKAVKKKDLGLRMSKLVPPGAS
jgi:hypothetical protein